MGKNRLFTLLFGLLWSGTTSAQIVQNDLTEITTGTVGVETAFSADLWGTDPKADDIIRQIEACADIPFTPTELKVLRAVLMTDVGGVNALGKRDKDYLNARLKTLMAQGLFEDVLTLIDLVPGKEQSNDLKQIKAEALFGAGRTEEACDDDLIGSFGTDESFVRVICADAKGLSSEAVLAYDVYRENHADGRAFLDAAGDILFRNLPAELPSGSPTLWELPMVAKIWGNDIFRLPLNRAQLWTLISSERVPHEVRLAAQQLIGQETAEKNEGTVLTALIQLANARQALEQQIPISARRQLLPPPDRMGE